MKYEDVNTSTQRSRSASNISFPPSKRSSPPLLLDERLTPEEVQSVIDLYLQFRTRTGLTNVLRMPYDPADGKLIYLATFVEQLLRGAARRFEKAEIDVEKVTGCVHGLLEDSKEVFDIVLNAAHKVYDQDNRHQSVRDLFRLSAIRLPQTVSALLNITTGGNLAMAVIQAWKSQYIGDYPAAIIAEIENHLAFPKLDGYGYIGAMIQTAGTGKSRTMHEIAAHVFTIPINIRKDSGGASYPDPDTELRDYLISPSGDLRIRYLYFLCTLFEKVREALKTLVGDETGEDAALRWRSYLDERNNREILYGNITREARRLAAEDSREKMKLAQRTKEAYRGLINTLTVDPNKKLKLLIYIDEAHTLTPRCISMRSNYASLCSVMADLDDPDHFIMFMSTSEALSLPKSDNLIVRACNVIATLPAPFTILPFDVYANIQYHDPELTFEHIRSIQHLARFGRPMWHTMLAAGARKQWIIFLARTKLTHKDCAETPKFGIHMGEPATVMSGSRVKGKLDMFKMVLVDIRVMIEYKFRRAESRRLQEEMVRAHMRVMFSAPAHGGYTTSGYPSEPILAEAAAISIYEERVDMVEVVHRLLEDDLLDDGERGQLVARLILTKAWDATVHRLLLDRKHPPMTDSHSDDQAVYSRPILLIDFLTALLPEEHLLKLFQSTPDNRFGGVTFAKAFEYAYVHFTHFGRAGRSDAINSGSGLATFIRGMAYQCSFGHSIADIFVPVLIAPKDRDVSPDFDVDRLSLDQFQRSGIMISVEDELNSKQGKHIINAEALGFWLEEDMDIDVPYITLSMQLVASQNLVVSSSPPGPLTTPPGPSTEIPSIHEMKLPSQVDKTKKNHPRYAVTISGCSPSVYKVIGADEQYKYLDIISSRGVLDEQPYKTPASVRLLKKMKPFWSLDRACFDWVHGLPDVGIFPAK